MLRYKKIKSPLGNLLGGFHGRIKEQPKQSLLLFYLLDL